MNTMLNYPLNWARNFGELETSAEEQQAEILPEEKAVPERRSSLVSRIVRFAYKHALEIACANAMTNWSG